MDKDISRQPEGPEPKRRLGDLGAPAIGALGASAIGLWFDVSPLGLAGLSTVGAAAGAELRRLARLGRLTPSAIVSPPPAPEPTPAPAADAAARVAETAARAPLPSTPIKKSRIQDGETFLTTLPAALLLLDASGRVVFANPTAVEELGRSPEGLELPLLLRAPRLIEAMQNAYRTDEAQEATFALHGAHQRTLFATIQPVEAEESGVRMMVLIQDHTRIRRAEQLHRDFVANASHELKTPLAAIAGFIETLRGPARDDPAARERFLSIMAQQAERMRLLIVDLMSLNRIELNEHVAPQDAIALEEIVEDALRHSAETAVAAQSSKRGAPASAPAIELALSAESPVVLGDRSELQQLVVNLIDNALKYGGDGQPPKVSVTVRHETRPRVGVTVEDFGPGIAKEHIPRLTERFYRAGSGGSDGPSGTGLGLAIVKHITARHRGELSIESRLGHGSRFTVWLPLLASTQAAQTSNADADAPA